jgi:hypothetical protein
MLPPYRAPPPRFNLPVVDGWLGRWRLADTLLRAEEPPFRVTYQRLLSSLLPWANADADHTSPVVSVKPNVIRGIAKRIIKDFL